MNHDIINSIKLDLPKILLRGGHISPLVPQTYGKISSSIINTRCDDSMAVCTHFLCMQVVAWKVMLLKINIFEELWLFLLPPTPLARFIKRGNEWQFLI